VSLLQALVLGLVQGLTEFLPISSSGHLVLVPFIVGWPEPSVAFVVATHVGTLAAVVWVFRSRLAELLRALAGGPDREPDRRLLLLLVLGTLPAALVGVALASRIEGAFERPVLASFLLGATGWALLSVESAAERRTDWRDESTLTPADAGVVGVAQAVAVLPGISRSGSTIAAGMARGLTREAAARFSFLLSIPVIVGATAVKLPDMVREGASGHAGAILLGVATSAVTGVVAIRAMLGVVARRGMRPFGVYCLLAMTAGLITALARG
jgi:undecaprenyl-diphosphatase